MMYRIPTIGCILFIAFCLSCTLPKPLDSRDLLELERVWQFLRVYSIWQDRVPAAPFDAFTTPEELAASMADTLYGNNYTSYWSADEVPPELRQEVAGTRAAAAESLGTVYYLKLSDSTVYIWIGAFGTYRDPNTGLPRTTVNDLQSINPNVPNVIVDLRGDPGGDIDVCTSSVELFLPGGVPFIHARFRKYYPATRDTATLDERWSAGRTGDRWEGKKVAVLIDSTSASAAEIFAAALRDGLGARLIGGRSYGKGIGQFIFFFNSGAAIRITSFQFMRTTGVDSLDNYHRKGIMPDTLVTGDLEPIIAAGKMLEGPGFALPPRWRLFMAKTAVAGGCFSVLHDDEAPH
jgi:hypothetical protein